MARLDTFTPDYMKTEEQSVESVEAMPRVPALTLDRKSVVPTASPAIAQDYMSQKPILEAVQKEGVELAKAVVQKRARVRRLKTAVSLQQKRNRLVGVARGTLPPSLEAASPSEVLSVEEMETSVVPPSELVSTTEPTVSPDDLLFVADEESLFEKPIVKVAAVAAVAAAGYFIFTRMS